MESLPLAQKTATILRDNKAENVVILKVPDSLWITDYFVIATGQSPPHLDFLRKEIRQELKNEDGRLPTHEEGSPEQEWLLSDYDSVIVHVFTEEQREYYDLEGLWADAEVVSA